ncbi:MAG TPA: TolC family protein [Gemmatimonadaceae bacterium]|nr:TolC family protein [Gemmatimonadaceae bacterium]
MSSNTQRSSRLLAAFTLTLSLGVVRPGAAQVLQPGLQPGLTRAPDSARKISLDEAIRMADQNAPAAVQAEGVERTSRAARVSAVGAIMPSVSVNLGRVIQYGGGQTRVNSNGEQVTIASAPVNSTGLNLNMTLFDGGQRLFNLRTAKYEIAAAEANRVAVKYNIALQVKQQYYAVLAAIESRDAAQFQMTQAAEQFRTSVAKVRAGVATRSDSLRGVIQIGNAQLALVTAQSNKEAADAALTRLVSSDVPVTADPASVQENMAALPDSAELAALAKRGPAVQQAQANVEAAEEQTKASKATYLPSLTASYSRTGSGTDTRFGLGNDPFSYNGRLSFSLSYPIFNNFAREEQVVRARVAQTNAQVTLRDTQLAQQEGLTQNIGALRSASQRVAIQVASVAAAEEDVRVQQQRYNIGASTFLDLITSQAALATAQQALIQARYDYRIARAQLEALIGRNLQ